MSTTVADKFTNIDKGSVHEKFNIYKVCSKMVLKCLTPDQKKALINICAVILNNVDTYFIL